MKELEWSQDFPHYIHMGAICCHGNQSSDSIFPKTLCSQSPTPMMLLMKFDYDWPAGFREIHVWKCGRTDGSKHGRTHGRRLKSDTISSPWALGSGELKRGRIINQEKEVKTLSYIELRLMFLLMVIECYLIWGNTNEIWRYSTTNTWRQEYVENI